MNSRTVMTFLPGRLQLRAATWMICVVLFAGTVNAADSRVYVDEDYGFRLTVPDAWKRMNPAGTVVPGEVCRAWSSGNGGTIVVFVQRSPKVFTAEFLADQTASGMERIGCTVDVKKVEAISGIQSMRLVVTGNGTGGTVDGKGKIRTTQEWIAIPRGGEIFLLILSAPESGFAAAQSGFTRAVSSLKFDAAAKK